MSTDRVLHLARLAPQRGQIALDARVAVTQRVLLKQMGFMPARKSKPTDEDDVDVDPTTGVITTPFAVPPHA